MASGQEQDFATFYDDTWGRTVACAFAVTADLAAAEDCAQEAYIPAWPRWSRLLTYEDPAGWVRQVATRWPSAAGGERGPHSPSSAGPGPRRTQPAPTRTQWPSPWR